MELLNLGQLPGEVGVRSEQATVHSAPSPWPFFFEMNETDNLVAAKLTLSGPFFWQNLGKRWNKSMFWWLGGIISRDTQLKRNAPVKMVSNLFFPRARKSPPLPLQFDFGCAMSNLGQDTTREGQELLFCEQIYAMNDIRS